MNPARIFICQVCGKAFLDDCPTCPDRGDGRGVFAAEILDAFRACPTVGDVNTTAQHYRCHVETLDKAGGEFRTEAIIIRNLARYMRIVIGETWRGQHGARGG